MIKKSYFSLAILILSVLLFGYQTVHGRYINNSSGSDFKDDDWNETFYDNAGLPSANSIKWIEENGNNFLRFTLNDKDKGISSGDRTPRHRAPYWERAELQQRAYLSKDSNYEINFKVRFLEGFNGSRESFFQIHQWTENCQTGPTMMLKIHYGVLILSAKKDSHKLTNYYVGGIRTEPKIEDLLGKWNSLKIVYSAIENKLTISLNESLIFENIEFVPDVCGIPHIKFGIYRPGDEDYPNNTSVADFDKFEIREIK